MDAIKEAAYVLRMPISQLCHQLGVSGRLMAYYRKKEMPPKICVKVEKMTNGAVNRQMLRPNDYIEIWPELGGVNE